MHLIYLLFFHKKLASKYKTLTCDEIKGLVVDDKWMITIERDIKTEVERRSRDSPNALKNLQNDTKALYQIFPILLWSMRKKLWSIDKNDVLKQIMSQIFA